MDPLTHTLVGAALARTRPARGIAFATAAATVGANLPDIDVLSQIGGADASLGFRRGWTHGPLAIVVLPLLLAWILFAIDTRLRRAQPDRPPLCRVRLLGLVYLACLTHPALDWLNTYGIRFLMPFDPRWFYGDAVFIIDPWLWLLLGGAVSLGSRGRRAAVGWLLLAVATTAVVLTAGAFVPDPARLLWCAALLVVGLARWVSAFTSRPERTVTVGLALAGTYIALMLTASTVGESRARAELERQGIVDVRDLMVAPTPANPFRWEVVAALDDAYRHGTLRLWPTPRLVLNPQAIPRPAPSPLVDAVLAADQVQGRVRWMRFPFLEIEETAEGFTVYLLDARYVRSKGTRFGSAVVHLDRALRVLDPGEARGP